MIDLNEFYVQYCANTKKTKFEMAQKAARKIFEAVQENYYDNILNSLGKYVSYSEICEWCGWPDFQDGGIFEQAIDMACNTVLSAYGFKPQHFVD